MRKPVQTVSGGCATSLRGRNSVFNEQGLLFDTPITIALSPGRDQFVSSNIDQANQGHQATSHKNHKSFNSGV